MNSESGPADHRHHCTYLPIRITGLTTSLGQVRQRLVIIGELVGTDQAVDRKSGGTVQPTSFGMKICGTESPAQWPAQHPTGRRAGCSCRSSLCPGLVPRR